MRGNGKSCLRPRGTGNGEKKDRCHRQKRKCSFSHSSHFTSLLFQDLDWLGDSSHDPEFVFADCPNLTARTWHRQVQESFQSPGDRFFCAGDGTVNGISSSLRNSDRSRIVLCV